MKVELFIDPLTNVDDGSKQLNDAFDYLNTSGIAVKSIWIKVSIIDLKLINTLLR